MKIEKGDKVTKWICIKDVRNIFKKDDVVDGGFMQIGIDPEDKMFYFLIDDKKHFMKFYWNYFMPLAKLREQQIKSILDD